VIVVRLVKMSVLGLAVAAVVTLAGPGLVASAVAGEGLSPWWGVSVGSRPTVLPPGGSGELVVWAQNRGDAATSGKVTITDVLPEKISVVGVKASAGSPGELDAGPVACRSKEATVTTVTCTFGEYENAKKEVVAESLPPFEQIQVRISVNVLSGASAEEASVASVSGGGAARTVSASRDLTLGESENFGFEDFQLVPENANGTLDTQAGSHPFQLTNVISLNQQPVDEKGRPVSAGLAKNIVDELPVGMFGNPTPFAQCTDLQFGKQPQVSASEQVVNECPADSAVGVATVGFTDPGLPTTNLTSTVPIFNVTPLAGEPARFGFKVLGIVSVFLDTSVQTGGNYAVNVGSYNITQIASLLNVRLTFWGVPGDKRHDAQRGWECLYKYGTCPPSTATVPPPFLVMPTSCAQPYASSLHGESWGYSGHPSETAQATYTLSKLIDGCNHLPFEPSISVVPDVPDASTSTGLTVGVHIPQEAALNPESLAESTLKDTTVVLPEGVTLNPAGADGLQACAESQIGFTGIEAGGPQRDLFTPGFPEPFCPNASKVGTVTIRTPLLAHAIEGAVYLATQDQNPFGSLVAMYLVAQDPVSGTLIKVAGEVKPDPNSGQILSTFKNTPELPFEDLELHFFGGERAPLATPSRCGSYRTAATFVPWSENQPATPSSTFNITSGPSGAPCPGAGLPFHPSLTAGTTSIQAGGFSPFTMTMSREDGQQNLQAISLHMPPGLSGLLAGVELCQEPQADQGLCGPNSQIGETTVSVGLGGDPFSVKGGRVYITGPYRGAPFGLSIVNPAKAGPFDLENTPASHPACDCIVVRAKIEVDPITAQLTVTSDNEGPYKIPTIIEGIPLEIKHVNVTINRSGFTFNPTDCNPMQITGSLDSTEGATSALSVPLQVTNCATLAFKPQFSLSTNGKTSRVNGASLHVKLAYPKAPFGSQANIAKVKVDLPKQLPSRLTTLQKACPDSTFSSNPAACPPESRIGEAKATTPLIPVPLSGPVYFVSHAGLKFPELVIVLSGYGVTVQLHAETFISKAGITSSTFRTIPDVPVGTFELNLPQGKFSALAAPGNLCNLTRTITQRKKVTVNLHGHKRTLTRTVHKTLPAGLVMPTSFVAQNGATIKQNTKIAVTGCPKAAKH
jgi:hypothetical protein